MRKNRLRSDGHVLRVVPVEDPIPGGELSLLNLFDLKDPTKQVT